MPPRAASREPSAESRLACTGAILAGGEARRFGGEAKGLLGVGGVRVIDRVERALRASCDDVLLVSNAADADGWLASARVVRDGWPGRGPLEGIRSALVAAGGAVLVVAWDMPFVPAALLASLRALGESRGTAAVPEGPGGAEPLCAYYPPSCLPVLERLLDGGERRARALLDHVPVARMPVDEVRAHGDPAWTFASVNTPHALASAERHAAAGA